jgi:hypothetical protein
MAEKTAAGAHFDVVLAASCVARYFTLSHDKRNVEAAVLSENLPEDMAAFGMFAFSEYCPVPGADEKLVNAVHSQTLVMCAF